jgi:beta-xylosidase
VPVRAVRRVAAVVAAATAGVVIVTASPAAALSTAPAYAGDFPDPFVLPVGGTYWAYSTGSAGRNLQVMSSTDLRSWTTPADPLPVLPRWASAGSTWAPGVVPLGGLYLMYYTVHDPGLGRQCISVATSTTPGGPFKDMSSGPLVCQGNGSIDPNPFTDPRSGRTYLLWKSDDNSVGLPTRLWASRLTSNGLSLTGGTALLLTETASSWQAPAMEGPTIMVASGSSTYDLFYGAGAWDTAQAGIGYATCSAPSTGFRGLRWTCSDRSVAAPWLATRVVGGAAVFSGPSGPAVFTDTAGNAHLAYHAWTGTTVGYANGGVRSLWIDGLSFPGGVPVLS